ncbi:MAG: hypothetical protein U5O15_08360 [Candidatus Krumholzibacteriota bacterium]|nr:hypothetical protein [Candidatus Krumholzibacteriota bacterium]
MANDDSTVGNKLAGMFFENWNEKSAISKLKTQHSIKSPEHSVFMSLFWLFYLAYTRAAMSSPDKISSQQFQNIADHLTTNVITKFKDIFDSSEDSADLLALYGGIAEGLFGCYNTNLNSSPSVHWHIGKEMCVILNGPGAEQDPSLITYFADMLHNDSVRIKEYFNNM